MKIEFDTEVIKSLLKVHPARITGAIACGLAQFIILGYSHLFYISFIPWVVYFFSTTVAFIQ